MSFYSSPDYINNFSTETTYFTDQNELNYKDIEDFYSKVESSFDQAHILAIFDKCIKNLNELYLRLKEVEYIKNESNLFKSTDDTYVRLVKIYRRMVWLYNDKNKQFKRTNDTNLVGIFNRIDGCTLSNVGPNGYSPLINTIKMLKAHHVVIDDFSKLKTYTKIRLLNETLCEKHNLRITEKFTRNINYCFNEMLLLLI